MNNENNPQSPPRARAGGTPPFAYPNRTGTTGEYNSQFNDAETASEYTDRHRSSSRGVGRKSDHEGSLTSHVTALTRDTINIMRGEIKLAKVEAEEKIDTMKRGATEIATGAGVLAGGLLVLLAAMVLILGLFIPYWASALIVGGVVTVIGMIMLGKGKRDVMPSSLTPDRTIAQLERDRDMIKEHI